MAQGKKIASIPGVADGRVLVGVPTSDELSAEDKVKAFLEGAMSGDVYQGWGSSFFHSGQVQLVSASSKPTGHVVFSFTVGAPHCNRLGNLHGGCTATLFDICTTVALAPIARPGFWVFAGVTRTLNVTYIRPIAEGEEIVIESEVVHAGKRLCMIKGVMRRKSDGAIMATCEHGKVSIEPELSKL